MGIGRTAAYHSTVSDGRQFTMSVPIDDDGFLRRECPTCDREFKWLHSDDAEADGEPTSPGGYFCPYCGLQAPPTHWWTKEQLQHASAVVTEELIQPELKDLKGSLEAASSGLISLTADISIPDPPASVLTEPNDMVRVDFECHPSEPLKVAETWREPVYCLICGMPKEPA
jgi:hypothetical protein